MRKIFVVIPFVCLVNFVQAQWIWGNIDSLKNSLASAKDDSARFETQSLLFWSYVYFNPDSSIGYARQDLLLAQKLKSDVDLYWAYTQYSVFASINGNYPEATRNMLQALKFAKQTNSLVHISKASNDLSDIYREEGDYEHAIYYDSIATFLLGSWTPNRQTKYSDTLSALSSLLLTKAEIYEQFNQLDSALKYATIFYQGNIAFLGYPPAPACLVMGNIYSKMGKYPAAFDYYRKGLIAAVRIRATKDVMDNYNGRAKTFNKTGQLDSAIFYAKKTIDLSQTAHYPLAKLDALNLLSAIYKSKNNVDSLARI